MKTKIGNCKERNVELCKDDFCDRCHINLSFKDCITGTYSSQILFKNGHSREEILRIYPEAKI